MQLTKKASSSFVVQRALWTKEEIFEDQVKTAVVKGLMGTVNDKILAFIDRLYEKKLLDKGKVGSAKYNTQKDFLDKEKTGVLAGISLSNLQKEELIMEAVSVVDVSAANWQIYKPEGKDKAEGSGANTIEKSPVKTVIEWGNDLNGQGTKVTAAVLGPDHPLGSVPSDEGMKKIVGVLSGTAKRPYIAGHLLNNNLGGPGNNVRNLTAIPKDVNSELSSQVESKVIEKVNKNYQFVYYDVAVEYGKDKKYNIDYASEIKVELKEYGKDTNFAKKGPGDIISNYNYVIPINSPSEYAKRNAGYNKQNNAYEDSFGKKHKLNAMPAVDVDTLARSEFNRDTHIILKDGTQIKLEFISFAIYSLQISKLKDEIFKLELDNEDLTEKQKEFDSKIKEFNLLKQQFTEIELKYRENEDVNIELTKEINELSLELEIQDESIIALKALLENKTQESRERAGEIGHFFGLEDGRSNRERRINELSRNRRMSVMSADFFKQGYNDGFVKGLEERARQEEMEKRKIQEEEEKDKKIAAQQEVILKLSTENTQKGEEIERLNKEIARLKVSLVLAEKDKSRPEATETMEKEPKESVELPGKDLKAKDQDLVKSMLPSAVQNETPEKQILGHQELTKSTLVSKAEDKPADVPKKKIEDFTDYLQSIYKESGVDKSGPEKCGIARWKYLAMLVYLGQISSSKARSEIHQNATGLQGKQMTPSGGLKIFNEIETIFKEGGLTERYDQ
jgi:hypothetical protein